MQIYLQAEYFVLTHGVESSDAGTSTDTGYLSDRQTSSVRLTTPHLVRGYKRDGDSRRRRRRQGFSTLAHFGSTTGLGVYPQEKGSFRRT
jgi:hypothetical protein